MKPLAIILALAVLAPAAVFVWPTKWRYDQVQKADGSRYTVKTNRFTGRTQILRIDSRSGVGDYCMWADEPSKAELDAVTASEYADWRGAKFHAEVLEVQKIDPRFVLADTLVQRLHQKYPAEGPTQIHRRIMQLEREALNAPPGRGGSVLMDVLKTTRTAVGTSATSSI